MTVTGYRLILPRHWVHLPTDAPDLRDRIGVFIDDALDKAPKQLSPDERGPARRAMETRLLTQLEAARKEGGRDVYLPGPAANGLLLGATIIVSDADLDDAPHPPGSAGGSGDDAHADSELLAMLAADGGRLVELDGTPWVRHDKVVPASEEAEVATRRVTYTGQRPGRQPGQPRSSSSWMVVAFSCVGDGNPTSAHTDLVVTLFDAVMGTWVWSHDDDPAAVLPKG